MMYIRLEDLIGFAYFTWCFDFKDVQADLYDILRLILRDGITEIKLPNDRVVCLLEHDLADIVDYLADYVKDIIDDIKEYENSDFEIL